MVKNELNDLFDFLGSTFKDETGIELIIVAFVDDLDRCLQARAHAQPFFPELIVPSPHRDAMSKCSRRCS